MNPKKIMILALIGALVSGAGLVALVLYRPVPDLPVYGQAPAFSLTSSEGKVMTQAAVSGKVWVADFFFSSCGGPCPEMAGNMKRLQETFEGTDLHLVNYSVDPETDTPEVLTRYAAKLKADTRSWHFLTGPEADVMEIAVPGFRLGDPDNLMFHSEKFVLVDRAGMIRGYYEGRDDQDLDRLIGDIRSLQKQRY